MASAQMYSGISQGLSQVADYERERPAREQRVAEAKTRQSQSQAKYEQSQALGKTKQSQADVELEQLRGELKTEKKARLKTETFEAFSRYDSDGDARHLNSFLKSAKKMGDPNWSKWTRFDSMTRTPETEAMLSQAGVTDIDAYFSDPTLVQSKILATDANGDHTLLDMNKLEQGLGYTDDLRGKELKAARERAEIDNLMMGTQSAETNLVSQIAEEEGISMLEAFKMVKGASGGKAGSSLERTVNKLMADDPELSYKNAMTQATRLMAGPNSTEKDINLTGQVREQLNSLSDTGSFYDVDLNDPGKRERAGELIVNLEKASGMKWSDATKKKSRQLNSLLKLGATAGEEITANETGILDNMLHKVKKYFTDSTDGVKGQAAYELYRNIQRNALYGATLPAGEIKAFNAAMGSLNMQLGPVLEQMRVSLVDTKEQLQTIISFEDPMVTKYRLGMTMDQAEAAIDALDERIRYFEPNGGKGIDLEKAKEVTGKQPVKVDMQTKSAPTTVDSSVPKSKEEVRAAWNKYKGQ
jgi:hypothetical protein